MAAHAPAVGRCASVGPCAKPHRYNYKQNDAGKQNGLHSPLHPLPGEQELVDRCCDVGQREAENDGTKRERKLKQAHGLPPQAWNMSTYATARNGSNADAHARISASSGPYQPHHAVVPRRTIP